MPKKVKLHLKGRHAPGTVEVSADRIATNDIILPAEYNPNKVRLWVLGNEYGVMGAVWAQDMGDALDELVDQDLGAGVLIDEADVDEDSARLGNAGEPADLTHAWGGEVVFDPTRDWKLLCAFAEARGSGADSIEDFLW